MKLKDVQRAFPKVKNAFSPFITTNFAAAASSREKLLSLA